MMKVLILGANGMLGYDLIKVFSKNKSYKIFTSSKEDLDITNKKGVQDKITNLKPDIVINAAAYTDVDGCETNKKLCMEVNGRAVGYIAQACKAQDSILVHFSTDYVFNGKKKQGYKEDEKQIDPINVYGQSKAEGEKELQKHTDKFYLIRTSWLYGKNGKNFVDTMLNLAKKRDRLKVVADQHGKPTYTLDLAISTKELIESQKPFGIYHLINENETTWYDFAKKIFEIAKIKIQIKPCTSDEFPRPAKRPYYSSLINTKFPSLRPWQEALFDYLKEVHRDVL